MPGGWGGVKQGRAFRVACCVRHVFCGCLARPSGSTPNAKERWKTARIVGGLCTSDSSARVCALRRCVGDITDFGKKTF